MREGSAEGVGAAARRGETHSAESLKM